MRRTDSDTRLLTKPNNTADRPVEVAFRDAGLTLRIRGGADVDRVLGAYRDLLDDPRFTPDMNSIWDLSEFDLREVALSEIRRLASAIREQMPRRGSGFKAALVTPRRVDFQLLRTYLVVLRLVGNLQLRAFTDVASAEAWLGN